MEPLPGPSGVQVKKQQILDQICDAIRVLGKPRVGASVIAIKKRILDAYDASEHSRINTQMKKAITVGEESGLLVRPHKCRNCVGATGSFLINTKKVKTVTNKLQGQSENTMKNMKKLYRPEDLKVVPKPINPKTTKTKNLKKVDKKKDDSDSEDFTHSTPKNSDSDVEQKSVKPRALKKTAKSTKQDDFMKGYASDSELTVVKQKTVKRKNLKEKSKTTTKNNKPGTSDFSKGKASQVNENIRARNVINSQNSDSVLL